MSTDLYWICALILLILASQISTRKKVKIPNSIFCGLVRAPASCVRGSLAAVPGALARASCRVHCKEPPTAGVHGDCGSLFGIL